MLRLDRARIVIGFGVVTIGLLFFVLGIIKYASPVSSGAAAVVVVMGLGAMYILADRLDQWTKKLAPETALAKRQLKLPLLRGAIVAFAYLLIVTSLEAGWSVIGARPRGLCALLSWEMYAAQPLIALLTGCIVTTIEIRKSRNTGSAQAHEMRSGTECLLESPTSQLRQSIEVE